MGLLIKVYLSHLLKVSTEKHQKFLSDAALCRAAFVEFIECLESETINLNLSILSEFPQHRRAKNVFIDNLRCLRLYRFNKKWAKYEKEYNTVANQDVFGRLAAFAPNQEALEKGTHLNAEQWELDRKKKIHSIITQLLKISKRNILC